MPINDSTNLLGLLDEFGYQIRSPNYNQQPDTTNLTLLGSLFLVQTVLCFLLNGLCFVYLFISHKPNSKYPILSHYFACKLVFTVILCISLLMSSVFYDTPFHIASSTWLCKLEFFGDIFMNTCENYLLFFLWIILLAERQLIGFNYLNNHLTVLTESTTTPFRVWCQKNSQTIVVGLMYTIVGLFTFIASSNVEKIQIVGFKQGLCATSSLVSLPIYLLVNYPLIFWFILFSTLLWKLFGSSRDPLLNSLNKNEIRLIKFIKLASLLRAFEVILVNTQVTFLQLFWKLDFKIVEFSRISGFFVIICTAMLFLYFEKVFENLWSLQNFRHPIERIRENLLNRNTTDSPDNIIESNQDSILYTNLI